jgi:ATP/maltotriose-dependent transcriptional regulator MalT/DNA-binding SARP family transcriptional activator
VSLGRGEGADVNLLARPRVADLLSDMWRRRTTRVVAGGGYGKTTALRQAAAGGDARWVSLRTADADGEALAARIAGALGASWSTDRSALAAATGPDDRLGLAERHANWLCERAETASDEVLLVLDDAEVVAGDEAAARLLRVLCLGAPPHLHVVLAGRRVPTLGLGTAQGRGEVLEVAAPDLAFTVAETADLLYAHLGSGAKDLAEEVQVLTGGWAAALQLVVDRLRRLPPAEHRPALGRLRSHRRHLWDDFAGELLSGEPPRTVRILEAASVAGVVGADLLEVCGVPAATADLEQLSQRGLLVDTGALDAGDTDEYALSPVLADVVAERVPAADAEGRRHLVAEWFEAQRRFEEALECRLSGPVEPTRALLVRRGHDLVRLGGAARVAAALQGVGSGGDIRLDTILAEALQAIGQWDGAIDQFTRVERAAGADSLPPEAAWRYGVLLYMRGQTAKAVDTLTAAHAPAGTTADDAMVAAWLSTALWSRGDTDRASELAIIAVRQAGASGDACALAAAYVADALVAASRGARERNEAAYRLALAAATEGGDRAQMARIHANLSSKALEEGDYRAAVAEAAASLNPGAGHRFFSALALCNKAEAHLRLGELEDARAAIDDAIEAYSTLGTLHVCLAYHLSGELYRERGDLARARLALERARDIAAESDVAHTLVFALGSLARTLAPDDRDAARAAATDAVGRASSLERAGALCALAEVELWAGEAAQARRLAMEAESEARRTADRAALAEALELRAAASVPPDREGFRDALAMWEEVANPIAAARTRLILARLGGDRRGVESARRELGERGVTADIGVARYLGSAVGDRRGEVAVTTLGRFSLIRGGETVPLAAWQSRKARDLFKVLVARRGRAITREAAMETLWPDQEMTTLSNRLSVALSTVRKVLDPGRDHPADYFVVADAQSICLRVEHLNIDVIAFLELAESAQRVDPADGEAPLRAALQLYAGDFLEEDLYEDWAIDCREEARSQVLMVLRFLARLSAARGDDEAVSQYLSQLLERDPYDEDAWLATVAAQLRLRRHGEARRRYAAYARRMAELEVAPVPLVDTYQRQP